MILWRVSCFIFSSWRYLNRGNCHTPILVLNFFHHIFVFWFTKNRPSHNHVCNFLTMLSFCQSLSLLIWFNSVENFWVAFQFHLFYLHFDWFSETWRLFYMFVCPSWLCGHAAARECTNSPTQSHTLQYELGTSKNETWEKGVMSHYHVTPTEDSAWADLLPRKLSIEEHQHSWTVMYQKVKNSVAFKPPVGFFSKKESLLRMVLFMLMYSRLIWRNS